MTLFDRIFNAVLSIPPDNRDTIGSAVLLAFAFAVGVLALNLAPAIDGCLR